LDDGPPYRLIWQRAPASQMKEKELGDDDGRAVG
jgi:hypothetical protein